MSKNSAPFLCIVYLTLAACGRTADVEAPPPASEPDPEPVAAADPVEITPGLSMRTLRPGDGETAAAGHTAVVHYTGWLHDEAAPDDRGRKFDSSVDRGEHFEFALGAGQVIRGWDEGVAGMQVGEIRELTIAPELAYGDRGAGSVIPPGATLVFEVELAGLKGVPAATQ